MFLQPADALAAFTQRQADAWAIWDPYTAQAEQQIPVRSIGEAAGVTNGDWFGIASDAALDDPKRNTALNDLLVRYAKATRWAKDHPEQVGGKLRCRSRSRPRGRDRRCRAAAYGCRPIWPTSWSRPNRSWPTCSLSRTRSARAGVLPLGRPTLQRRAAPLYYQPE